MENDAEVVCSLRNREQPNRPQSPLLYLDQLSLHEVFGTILSYLAQHVLSTETYFSLHDVFGIILSYLAQNVLRRTD